MKELLKRLSSKLFVQTHHSYVVNFKKVQSVDLEESTINVGDKQVALSKRNREEELKKLN
jgi:DNA-binding LytR/AlgR family response regulator